MVPKEDWESHLARALQEAENGDEILVPDSDIRLVAETMLIECYPTKQVHLTAQEIPPFHRTTGSVADYVQQRTESGDPPSPQEIQSWINRERAMADNRVCVSEWFGEMLTEYLGNPETLEPLDLMDRLQVLVEDMAFHIGGSITMSAQAAGLAGICPKQVMKTLRTMVQHNIQRGMGASGFVDSRSEDD
jgi:hypothetical protein